MSDAEDLIVAAMLRTPGRHESRLSGLLPEWFANKADRAIYKVLRARPLTFAGIPVVLRRIVKSPALLQLMLVKVANLAGLPEAHDADVDEAARSVCDAKKHETIIDRCRWILESAKDGRYAKAEEAAKILHVELASYDPLGNPPTEIGDLAGSIEVEYAAAKSSGGVFLSTGIHGVDAKIGGGKKGEMWVLGGFSGDGKTTCALNILYHRWMNGSSPLLIPREMTKKQIIPLLIARHSVTMRPDDPIRVREVFRGTLSDEHRAFMGEVVADIKKRNKDGAHFRIWEAKRNWTIEDLTKYLDGTRYGAPVDVLCVDMLRQLAPVRRRNGDGADRVELNETLGAAKQLAVDYNGGRGLWLLAPHQISREGRKFSMLRKPHPHYLMSDLQDSSRAEQDADVVMCLLRTPRLKAHRQAILNAPKVRGDDPIELGIKVFADYGSTYIGSIDEDDEKPGSSDFDDIE